MTEVWKDIEGFEDSYQISNMGRFRSKDRHARIHDGVRRVKGKILCPIRCKNGYMEVQMSKGQKRTVMLLHRAVAKAFIPNPDNLPEVNHKDEDITNNCADNLEWCTSKYNANYGSRNARMMENRVFVPVIQKALDGTFIKQWDCMTRACEAVGADISSMIRVCKGKQHTCRGYKWEYAQ